MGRARHQPSAARLGLPGLWLALVAIASQLGFAAAKPGADPSAAIASAAVICHGGPSVPNDQTPPPHPAHPDCAVCPLCAAIGVPAPVLAAGPEVAAPTDAGVWQYQHATPTMAVPVRKLAAAQPRGPPFFI